jgi:hypothetical protein
MPNPYLQCLQRKDTKHDDNKIDIPERKLAIKNAKKYLLKNTDVNKMIQNEPACSLYALSVVLNAYGIRNKPFDMDKLCLQKIAKEAGFFHQNHISSVIQLGELASFIYCGFRIYHYWDASTIKEIIAKGHLVLVPFDVDSSGNIGQYKGQSVHWAIIEDINSNKVTASHGWSNLKYEWNVIDLIQSNQQLEQTIIYDKFKTVISCIQLRNKILEIVPPEKTNKLTLFFK